MKERTQHRRRNGQSGFMLLFVFLLAATAAISLYIELPRIAFESQRMKEDLLVERGMQYQRAIQLYVRKNRRYPARIEDLESSNGQRFLRRRYVDPMTGKDEWRFIKVGPMGEFLDSVTMKKDDKKKSENTFISEYAGIGQTATGQGGAVTVANRQRQSDLPNAPGSQIGGPEGAVAVDPDAPPQPNANFDPNNPQQMQQPQQQPGVPPPNVLQQLGVFTPPNQDPNQQQPQPQQPQPYPQQQYPQQYAQNPPGFPQTGQPGFNPVGRYVPGVGTSNQIQQNPFGRPSSSQTGGTVPQPYPQQPGAPGANSAVAQQIMQMITQPRQGGPQQVTGAPGMPGVPGAGVALGPGIAGVASKFDAEGIKIVNERTNYKEWEFIYDIQKEMQNAAGGANAGMPGMPGANNPLGGNTNPGNATGLGGSTSTGFGNSTGSPGFGNSSGFGNSQQQRPPSTGGFGRGR
jgi:hypothetical protein